MPGGRACRYADVPKVSGWRADDDVDLFGTMPSLANDDDDDDDHDDDEWRRHESRTSHPNKMLARACSSRAVLGPTTRRARDAPARTCVVIRVTKDTEGA